MSGPRSFFTAAPRPLITAKLKLFMVILWVTSRLSRVHATANFTGARQPNDENIVLNGKSHEVLCNRPRIPRPPRPSRDLTHIPNSSCPRSVTPAVGGKPSDLLSGLSPSEGSTRGVQRFT